MTTWTGTLPSVSAGEDIFASDIATLIAAMTAFTDPLTPYTPVWSSSGTAVSLGNGSITGFYLQVGKFVTGRITLTMGSTTTFGTGNYSITLPVGMAGAAWDSFASLTVRDASGATTYSYGAFSISTASISGGSNAGLRWGPANPITFATSDICTFAFTYEAA